MEHAEVILTGSSLKYSVILSVTQTPSYRAVLSIVTLPGHYLALLAAAHDIGPNITILVCEGVFTILINITLILLGVRTFTKTPEGGNFDMFW